MDQAETLRRMMQSRQTEGGVEFRTASLPHVITISSGKGGVGKSCFAATMGTMLARSGHRVLLVDADFGLANLDILLNVQPVTTLDQVLSGSATLQEAIVGVEPNLWLIPSSSGLIEIKQSDRQTRERLLSLFEQFPWEMDFIILDSGAGIQENVLSMHSPEFNTVVMLTPEPTSFTDAYGLIKTLRRKAGIKRVGVVVNQVTDGREGSQIYQRLREVSVKFLDVQLDYLGHWQRDEKVLQSVLKRKILLDLDEGAGSIPSLRLLAKRFQSQFCEQTDERIPSLAAPLRTGRFMEGPISGQKLAGKTANFFKTLLGEVKA